MSAPVAPTDLDYLKLWVPFLGGLLGGLLGTPLLEWFKDRLSAWRIWQSKRKEIVEAIRFFYAHIEAFWELKDHCYGKDLGAGEKRLLFPGKKEEYIEPLRSFDLSSLTAALRPLIELGPRSSERSASAQYLVQQVLILVAVIKSIQKTADNPPPGLLAEADSRLTDLKIFVGSVYAQTLGINGFEFGLGRDVWDFRNRLAKLRSEQADENLRAQVAKYNAMFPEHALKTGKDA